MFKWCFMYRQIIIVSICIIITLFSLQAQDGITFSFSIPSPNELSLIKMKGKSGITYVGSIIEHNQEELTILTDEGPKITISLSSVQDIRVIPKYQIHSGEYWYSNQNDSRYLFSPSAFNLKKGEGYYQNTNLLLNTFNYGITDNFSMGFGFEFLSTLAYVAGLMNPSYFLIPKYSTQVSENIRLGVGLLYGNIHFMGGFGVGYGLVTYGNPEHNATLGLGFGMFDREFSSHPVITLSGMTRLSRRFSLVTENWFLTADNRYQGYYTSLGIRFLGEKEKFSVDIAVVNDISKSNSIPIPYVDLVVKF